MVSSALLFCQIARRWVKVLLSQGMTTGEGCCRIEPLESGFGQTQPNALKRLKGGSAGITGPSASAVESTPWGYSVSSRSRPHQSWIVEFEAGSLTIEGRLSTRRQK